MEVVSCFAASTFVVSFGLEFDSIVKKPKSSNVVYGFGFGSLDDSAGSCLGVESDAKKSSNLAFGFVGCFNVSKKSSALMGDTFLSELGSWVFCAGYCCRIVSKKLSEGTGLAGTVLVSLIASFEVAFESPTVTSLS